MGTIGGTGTVSQLIFFLIHLLHKNIGAIDKTIPFNFFSQNRASGVAAIFNWRNFCKPISSMFIGTSPEFELALFNVCYHARRNRLCSVTLGGTNLNIQTFDITRSGRTFVSTAYPVIN